MIFLTSCCILIPNSRYKPLFENKENIHCLEIGSFEGRSTIYMLNNFCNGQNSSLDALDTWNGSIEHKDKQKLGLYDRFLYNTKSYIDSHKLFIYRDFSANTLAKFAQEVDEGVREKYDVVYVDGSHTSKDVLLDATLSWKILKKDGIMLFDDYLWKHYQDPEMNPQLGIDQFLQEHESKYTIIHKGYQIHIKKIQD